MEQSSLRQTVRHPLLAILAFYLLIVTSQSLLKLVWGDELFTYYVARTGSLASIWKALDAGADPNPPLTHSSVLFSTRLFGVHALSLRAPSILYVGIALGSMWSILRTFVRPAFASIGLLAFMCTRGFDYSYDARSYAPMMGFAMASLAFWLAATAADPPRHRLGLLFMMALALTAGLYSNYYCVLAFFPIAAGQVVLDRSRRRLDIHLWFTLVLAALPLLALLPLIRHNIAEFGPHAWNRPSLSMISFSYLELVEGILWPTLVIAGLAWFRRSRSLGLPAHALAALVTLLLYPFLGYLVAIGGAGMISPRCVAPVCCGVGLLAGLATASLVSGQLRPLRAIVILLVVWVIARESFCSTLLYEQRRAFLHLRDEARKQDRGRPILVSDSLMVLPLYFYSDSSTASRILFPIDFEAIHHLQADDSGEQNLWSGRRGVFPFPVTPFEPPASSALVIARPDGWLADSLRKSGATIQDSGPDPAWDRVGGVFSPMAHPETRFLNLQP